MTARRKTLRKGRLIVLEGLDGAGTTTQSAALVRQLSRRGETVMATCQPSAGPVGMLLRQALIGRLGGLPSPGPTRLDPYTLALLFAADRADHVAQVVEPALATGQTVICDRYLLSSLAYQGMELGLPWVESINAAAPVPDLTLFLKVDPKLARSRLLERGRASGKRAGELFDALRTQQRVARAYQRAIAFREGRERIVQVDGGMPVEQVTNRLLEEIDALAFG